MRQHPQPVAPKSRRMKGKKIIRVIYFSPFSIHVRFLTGRLSIADPSKLLIVYSWFVGHYARAGQQKVNKSSTRFSLISDDNLLIYTLRNTYTLHSALLISDLGIYFSNPRGTYIEQVSPGEPEKKTSGNWDLICSSGFPLSCADAFVTRVCPQNTGMCQNKCGTWV